MFQKFHTDTLMSRFIKSMLSYQPLSVYDYVTEGDMLIEGFQYIYKNLIIRCVRTGILFIGDDEHVLFPSTTLYPSSKILPKGGDVVAIFQVTHYVHEVSQKQSACKFHSKTHWYDGDTHKYLGEYLRMLRSTQNLNLMPYYNCYSTTQLVDVYLKPLPTNLYPSTFLTPSSYLHPKAYEKGTSTYVFGNNDDYRIIAVPIKFNRKYTIALECSTDVQLRCLIYDKTGMVVAKKELDNIYYSDYLESSYVLKPSARFNEPFVYEVKTTDKNLYARQRDLLLAIQVPNTCKSSIVVLEGDYTKLDTFQTSLNGVRKLPEFFNLSLLRYNTNDTVAFADRLIEYLLLNVVTHQDPYSGNIQKYQHLLSGSDSIYTKNISSQKVSFGVWDDEIRNAVSRVVQNSSTSTYLYDQDGYINKDVERLLYSLHRSGN